MTKLFIGILCECGKSTEDIEVILSDGGEAPLRCPNCKRYFRVTHVDEDMPEVIFDISSENKPKH